MAKNLLITSSGRKNPLVKAAGIAIGKLTRGLVVAGDTNPNMEKLTENSYFWAMPKTSPENLAAIIAGCEKRGIGFVLPTRDSELQFWASNRDVLQAAGVLVAVSSPEAINLSLDKLKFFEELQNHDGAKPIATSKTIEDIHADTFVVKEQMGAGSTSVGVRLTREAAVEHARTLTAPLFQPFVDGREVSVDAYFSITGELVGLVLRDRLVVIEGESQVSRTFTDYLVEGEVRAFLEYIGEKYGFFGPIVLQAVVTPKGEVAIIEVNARFGGASTTSIQVGLDSIFWALIELSEESNHKLEFRRSGFEIELNRRILDSFTSFLSPESKTFRNSGA